ncbi:MAG: hypothetical protein ABFS10_13940 [Bacteroidota bacterium]
MHVRYIRLRAPDDPDASPGPGIDLQREKERYARVFSDMDRSR